ncbi:MAG: hypothetical protein IID15_08625, partial [Candidatus Marinimicrobia bacterium]|nr:hypothetical protein [Candidatus Neomarinimicrobiota bacterium]
MMMHLLQLLLGGAFIYVGAEGLVWGGSKLAHRLHVSPIVIGLSVVAFGTSLPEFTVSLYSVFNDVQDIAIGNITGSNIANIALILAVSAIIFPISCRFSEIRKDLYVVILVTVLFMLLAMDGLLSRTDGGILVAGMVAYLYRLVKSKRVATVISDNAYGLPHYGAASLFMKYLAQHYGGHDNLSRLVARPEDGGEGITAYLQSMGYEVTFREVFRDWLVANYLDSHEIGVYFYDGLNVGVGVAATIREQGQHSGTVPQYAGEYIEIRLKEGDVRVSFQGQAETPLLPVSAHSGSYCWWGNRGDSIDSTLTASIDLSQVSQATLNFWVW